MTAATPGQALTRWRSSEIIEVDAARLTPDNLDELWQSFESKPHYDADRNVDGLAVYADHGREVALFGEWICRRVDDGLPFTLADAEFRRRYEPADAAQDARPAPEQVPAEALDIAWNALQHIALHAGDDKTAAKARETLRAVQEFTEDGTAPELAGCGCPKTDGKIYHQRGTCTDPAVAALDWYADAGRIAAAPAPELAEPVTVAGVPYSDHPSLVAAMQAEIDRERTARLHMAGERDEVRSDVARVRRAILASGKTHQWKIQQLLAIVGEIPAGEPEQPAPELADAVAKSDRYREALENVFAVLDRNILTYAERISYARTLIRTAREGK